MVLELSTPTPLHLQTNLSSYKDSKTSHYRLGPKRTFKTSGVQSISINTNPEPNISTNIVEQWYSIIKAMTIKSGMGDMLKSQVGNILDQLEIFYEEIQSDTISCNIILILVV